jgi:hypothetical protein
MGSEQMTALVVAEASWSIQIATCAALIAVLFLLVRYLWRGPRARGTLPVGMDAWAVTIGALNLVGAVVLSALGKGVPVTVWVLGSVGLFGGLLAHLANKRERSSA